MRVPSACRRRLIGGGPEGGPMREMARRARQLARVLGGIDLREADVLTGHPGVTPRAERPAVWTRRLWVERAGSVTCQRAVAALATERGMSALAEDAGRVVMTGRAGLPPRMDHGPRAGVIERAGAIEPVDAEIGRDQLRADDEEAKEGRGEDDDNADDVRVVPTRPHGTPPVLGAVVMI
jgi:hypothetical protein